MRYFQRFLLLVVLASVTFACQKDDEDTGPVLTAKERQIAKRWRVAAFTINPPFPVDNNGTTVPITDVYQLIGTCQNDNVYIFNADPKRYTQEAGAVKCTGQSQVIEAGTWFLSSDESTVVLDVAGSLENWQILELTDSQLRVSYPIVFEDEEGNPVIFTLTRTLTAVQ